MLDACQEYPAVRPFCVPRRRNDQRAVVLCTSNTAAMLGTVSLLRSWVSLRPGTLERIACRGDGVVISGGVLVVSGAGGADLETVAELVRVRAESNSIAPDSHRSRHAVQVDEGAISHAVTCVAATGGDCFTI
jgi:hypothetical protein